MVSLGELRDGDCFFESYQLSHFFVLFEESYVLARVCHLLPVERVCLGMLRVDLALQLLNHLPQLLFPNLTENSIPQLQVLLYPHSRLVSYFVSHVLQAILESSVLHYLASQSSNLFFPRILLHPLLRPLFLLLLQVGVSFLLLLFSPLLLSFQLFSFNFLFLLSQRFFFLGKRNLRGRWLHVGSC